MPSSTTTFELEIEGDIIVLTIVYITSQPQLQIHHSIFKVRVMLFTLSAFCCAHISSRTSANKVCSENTRIDISPSKATHDDK